MRADRGQCDLNSAPGQRLKLASKTGARLVAAESAQFAHIVEHVLVGSVALDQRCLPRLQAAMAGQASSCSRRRPPITVLDGALIKRVDPWRQNVPRPSGCKSAFWSWMKSIVVAMLSQNRALSLWKTLMSVPLLLPLM